MYTGAIDDRTKKDTRKLLGIKFCYFTLCFENDDTIINCHCQRINKLEPVKAK